MADSKIKVGKIATRLVPVPIFLGMVYLSWAYSYYICWNEIYKHHSKATGIGLIVGNILFILLIDFIWLQILAFGPGFQPKVPLYRIVEGTDETSYRCIIPPDHFMCDAHGYPIWCSTCQSIKIDRSHHSSQVDRCVGRMDHYCTFIGAVIGKRNHRLFMQFCFWYLSYFIYIGISMALFTKSYKERVGSVNPNTIVVYVFCIGWIILIFALFSSHIYYIFYNRTSLDDMAAKRSRRTATLNDEYMSVLHEKRRYVLRVSSIKDDPWNKGFCKNWCEIMGSNALFWIVPWGTPIRNEGNGSADDYNTIVGDYKEEISHSYHNLLLTRIENGDFL